MDVPGQLIIDNLTLPMLLTPPATDHRILVGSRVLVLHPYTSSVICDGWPMAMMYNHWPMSLYYNTIYR